MALIAQSLLLPLRALVLASLFMAPVGALAYNTAGGLGIEKQGAGLVLFVTLQRNAMQ